MSPRHNPEYESVAADWEQLLAAEGLGDELPADEAIAVGDDLDLDRDARADRAVQAELDAQSDGLWDQGSTTEEEV